MGEVVYGEGFICHTKNKFERSWSSFSIVGNEYFITMRCNQRGGRRDHVLWRSSAVWEEVNGLPEQSNYKKSVNSETNMCTMKWIMNFGNLS